VREHHIPQVEELSFVVEVGVVVTHLTLTPSFLHFLDLGEKGAVESLEMSTKNFLQLLGVIPNFEGDGLAFPVYLKANWFFHFHLLFDVMCV